MKTLKQKFKFHCCGETTSHREHHINSCVKIAEEFALDFYSWMRKEERDKKWFHYTDEDMLNAFKEEREY